METKEQIRPGSVVVGFDGSEHSELAVRWAADEADLDGRALTIVTAVSVVTGYELSVLAGGWTPPDEVQAAIRRHAQEQLDGVKASLHQNMPDLEVEVLLVQDDARRVLLDLSRSAASIFVGSRGRGTIATLLLGSVSVAVARAAECPVFVIRAPHPGQERQGVLVGTDCLEQTRPTLEFAYRQAALRGLPLTVLHCFDSVETFYGSGEVLPDDLEGYDDERLELAEAVAGMAEKFPEVQVRLRLGRGRPEECLIKESQRMDLVVVGHHAGRGFGDLLHLGSYVAPIVEGARCPVAIAVDRTVTS